ncbi:hypothetical protein [Paraburkholderia flagellata]|nr:hypothetical protein [Paraburkholderia flagellata]
MNVNNRVRMLAAAVGAVGGCIVGHHVAKKNAAERAAQHEAARSQKLNT